MRADGRKNLCLKKAQAKIFSPQTQSLAKNKDNRYMYKERNSKIIKMIEKGKTVKEAAITFDISTGRVLQIVKSNEEKIKNDNKIDVFVNNVRIENNLKTKWKIDLIIDCLKLSKIANNSLNKYFEKQNIVEICLLDFMDDVITKKLKNKMCLFEAIPIFNQKNIGSKTIINIINNLSSCKFGDNFEKDWGKRKIKLKKYLVKNNFTMQMRIK